ncbi:MAG: septum formation initiator family protein [Alphaproteobacteria bacterium]|nr:septum formation initiator family protein [Alphaproteobacteria bacterium]
MKEIRRRLPYAAGQVLGCLVVAYFAYHLVEGDRGLLAMRYLKQEIVQTRTMLQGLEAERGALEARVALLRPSGLDPDMLDERARLMLNLAAPGEIVIPLNQGFMASPPARSEPMAATQASAPRRIPARLN